MPNQSSAQRDPASLKAHDEKKKKREGRQHLSIHLKTLANEGKMSKKKTRTGQNLMRLKVRTGSIQKATSSFLKKINNIE